MQLCRRGRNLDLMFLSEFWTKWKLDRTWDGSRVTLGATVKCAVSSPPWGGGLAGRQTGMGWCGRHWAVGHLERD